MPWKGKQAIWRSLDRLRTPGERIEPQPKPSEVYEYEPLPGAAHIRLLRFLPVEPHGVIHCELSTHAKVSCPSYEALSYTWGDEDEISHIVCDGRRMRVTKNCERALWALRTRSEDGVHVSAKEAAFFWIDAICINQADAAEQSRQVSRMNEIYERASRTVVYLGQPDEHSDALQELFDLTAEEFHGQIYYARWIRDRPAEERVGDRLSYENRNIYWFARQLADQRPLELTFGQLRARISYLRDDPKWLAKNDSAFLRLARDVKLTPRLCIPIIEVEQLDSWIRHWYSLVNRPWFTRTWIIQETMLSRDIVGLVGSREVSWNRIMDCHTYLSVMLRDRAVHIDGQDLTYANFATVPLFSLRHRQFDAWDKPSSTVRRSKLHTLLQTLLRVQEFQCKDPRDKLFALLALFESVPAILAVDYTKTVADVYTNLTWFLLDYDIPDVLRFAGTAVAVSDLPSWVVDWRSLWVEKDLRLEDSGATGGSAGFTKENKRMVAHRDGAALVIRGRLIQSRNATVRQQFEAFDKETHAICVLLGCPLPFVLEREKANWRLCYTLANLDGFMHGEAVADIDWSRVDSDIPKPPLQDFRIV